MTNLQIRGLESPRPCERNGMWRRTKGTNTPGNHPHPNAVGTGDDMAVQ